MKAITPVISIIILLLITISLAGMGWTYMSGYYEAMTAKQIKLVEGSAFGNELMLMNIGTASITESELKILVNGKEAPILNMTPAIIEPKKSARIIFEFVGLDQSSVRLVGPGNAVTYSHDIELEELHDLISWWKFDEGSGNTAGDSGSGNDGTFGGTPTWRQGSECISGSCLEFNSGDIINVNAGTRPASTEWSVTAWVSVTGSAEFQYLLSFNSGNLPRVELHHTTYSLLYLNSAADDYYRYGNLDIRDSQWHHIAFVFRDSDNHVKIYIDGQDRTGVGPNGNEVSVAGTWRIGGFEGFLDEVKVWNRALSEDEVKALSALGP